MHLKKFLNLTQPELYDLKEEKDYSGNNSLEKMLEYKRIKDGFDCDGSLGNDCCILIREIYRKLWGWKDVIEGEKIKRYALTCIDDELLMGPETMNSFQTTYRHAKELEIDNKDIMVLFAESVGRVGNMTLTYAGFNKYIAYDYWDIKIKRQYIDNISLSDDAKTRYINLFFQWDYVDVSNNKYALKTFWEGHEKKYLIGKDVISKYIKLVDIYTKRRGVFMVRMLRIADICENDYKLIRDKILMSNTIFYGYIDVINKAKELKYKNNKTYEILDELLQGIKLIDS